MLGNSLELLVPGLPPPGGVCLRMAPLQREAEPRQERHIPEHSTMLQCPPPLPEAQVSLVYLMRRNMQGRVGTELLQTHTRPA